MITIIVAVLGIAGIVLAAVFKDPCKIGLHRRTLPYPLGRALVRDCVRCGKRWIRWPNKSEG